MQALGDVIVNALREFLRRLFTPVRGVIETHANDVLATILTTPHPNAVLSKPTNGPWPGLYDYYWDTMVPLSLFLWSFAIGLVILFETTSHLFSSYHRSKLQKRAFSGLIGILSWWWIAAFSLRFTDALIGFLVPDLSDITLFQTLSFSSMGVLGFVIAMATDWVLFVLVTLLYFTRQLVLYLFVLLMPVLMAFWVPGVGPFTLVSRFMKRLASFYVPFLFMAVPVAVLFRLGDLLGRSFELDWGGIGAWLTALVIPFVALVAPLVMFWQAGALFFLADRASRRMSVDRARGRTERVREGGRQTAQGGRNFLRGVRKLPAVKRDGQTVLDSGSSRAHGTGSRLNTAGSRLAGRLRSRNGHGDGKGTAATEQSDGAAAGSDWTPSRSTDDGEAASSSGPDDNTWALFGDPDDDHGDGGAGDSDESDSDDEYPYHKRYLQ